jgi:hypothetical protein
MRLCFECGSEGETQKFSWARLGMQHEHERQPTALFFLYVLQQIELTLCITIAWLYQKALAMLASSLW